MTKQTSLNIAVQKLTSEELVNKICTLVNCERIRLGEFLLHLAEFDSRRLYLDEACSSCFSYLTDRLHYSDSSAFRRLEAARLSLKYPVILERVTHGKLTLVSLCMVRKILKPENVDEILCKAESLSQRELEKFVAIHTAQVGLPTAPKRDQIQFLSANNPSAKVVAKEKFLTEEVGFMMEVKPENLSGNINETQIGLAKARIHFTADEKLVSQIEEVKIILSNKYGIATLEQVFGYVMNEFLEKHSVAKQVKKREEKQKNKSINNLSNEHLRYIPQSVKDTVFLRDGGQCTYVSPSGVRCKERRFLNYDHKTPFALGGKSTDVENIRCLCSKHNKHAAIQVFGKEYMNKWIPIK